jgi:hypothetical protein
MLTNSADTIEIPARFPFLNNIIKKKLVERAKVGHGSLYRETDTVLKKLLILIKY